MHNIMHSTSWCLFKQVIRTNAINEIRLEWRTASKCNSYGHSKTLDAFMILFSLFVFVLTLCVILFECNTENEHWEEELCDSVQIWVEILADNEKKLQLMNFTVLNRFPPVSLKHLKRLLDYAVVVAISILLPLKISSRRIWKSHW